jgi:DNA uptake protein ComE-like DNA-binding protein
MAMNKIIKDYFTFSKKETFAALILVLIIAVFIALPYINSNSKKREPINPELAKVASTNLFVKDTNASDDFENDKVNYKSYSNSNYKNANYTLTPFNFDPNILDENGWNKLGLPKKTIKTILNYLGKGGKFKSAEDIRKIWGLKKEDADVLIPYITIVTKPTDSKYSNTYTNKNYTKPAASIIDINTATVDDFKRLPAVGNTAYKILKFREKLGGFVSISQIKETYGLTDSVYQAMLPYLSIASTNIQKININTASDFDLGKHPYISNDIAKAIVIYRKQHGNYSKIEDVRKIVFINQAMYQKIAPYITVE